MNTSDLARRAIALLDLTSLGDDDTDDTIIDLCRRAVANDVAAVCIWPRFVSLASDFVAGSTVAVATVVNFPGGNDDVDAVVAQTNAAIGEGADEIDLVVPYRRAIDGDLGAVTAMVAAVRASTLDRRLKAILETGALTERSLITAVAEAAIAGGADMLKTSTGKISTGATIHAAEAMLDAISRADRLVGLKISGGVKTIDDATAYLSLADDVMGSAWATASTFRFGASSLLDDLLNHL